MLEGRDQLNFGIPKKRKEKEQDPYEGTPVLKMKPAPENKGETYKFELNEDALDLLNLKRDDANDIKKVSFSFIDESNSIYIGNTTNLDVEEQYKYNVSMIGIFSNSIAHRYIKTFLDINDGVENVFELEIEEGVEDIKIAKLNLLKQEENTVNENSIKDTINEMNDIDNPENFEVLEEL